MASLACSSGNVFERVRRDPDFLAIKTRRDMDSYCESKGLKFGETRLRATDLATLRTSAPSRGAAEEMKRLALHSPTTVPRHSRP
jgi:hypothetical protein